MKKYLLILLCAVTVMFSSCKKEVLIPDTNNITILQDIFPRDWQRSPDGTEFSFQVSVPEIDGRFLDGGSVVVAMSFEDVNVYEALPQTYQGYSYRATYQAGRVTFYLNYPLGGPVDAPTFESTAKISLIDGRLVN